LPQATETPVLLLYVPLLQPTQAAASDVMPVVVPNRPALHPTPVHAFASEVWPVTLA
jgi:hypothetical protein